MKLTFADGLSQYKDDIILILNKFKNDGTLIGNGTRNIIKFFDLDGFKVNFKSFKQHNIINRHVYKFYRKSKARRSFEYAHMLISKNFYTPKPIAYIENHDFIGLTSSYYISEQLENSRTLADILADNSFSDRERIIKEYTAMMHRLHNNGIVFLDNSPGNFLIKKEGDDYCIYLVDLNRMNFYEKIELDKRLKNFARLTNDPEIIKTIATEYASLEGASAEYCLEKINQATQRMLVKRRIKKVLKLYKKVIKI
ncbi:lipopolysaccharide kinase [Chryseobacterium sp. IHB B 17019]|jgi:tRNA A-37 threonylcarbamoyl transferase component Bud32|uniref:lipopolysaccharide kinase InaA family protein n=1 Tax=Chryseobacterium sp. IHB B 17019 TaxID=1721091 RepID=UPI000720C038|nr:lipopolysaccharide kinase InaA family protein [Chryseobacterium sp. IHB B 17019]ALR30799.1 lipopolysaccharide kinase [Chryseobacterium sp. IHB B 17019]